VALYPGTKLYEEEKKNGALSDSIWFNKNDAEFFCAMNLLSKKDE
jgi:hypothetical protein